MRYIPRLPAYILRAVMRITSFPRIYSLCGRMCARAEARKPHIFVADIADTRDAVATLCALRRTGRDGTCGTAPCMVVSETEYARNAMLRSVSRRRLIRQKGGLNTEWVHDGLKRLRNGQSLLMLQKAESGAGTAAVFLSLMSGAEIVPLYSPPHKSLFRRQRIAAGAPMSPDRTLGLTAEALRHEFGRVQAAIRSLAAMTLSNGGCGNGKNAR